MRAKDKDTGKMRGWFRQLLKEIIIALLGAVVALAVENFVVQRSVITSFLADAGCIDAQIKQADHLLKIKDYPASADMFMRLVEKDNIQSKTDSELNDLLNVDFPLSEDDVESILNFETLWATGYRKWEYVSTRTSHNGGEAFVGKDEKLVLVDHWTELLSSDGFATVDVYKYYRYKKVVFQDEEKSLTIHDVLQTYNQKGGIHYLSDFGISQS